VVIVKVIFGNLFHRTQYEILFTNQKVKTKCWEHSLYFPKQYNYTTKNVFIHKAQQELDAVKRE
jgi:ABC-type microcin C transport system permease subunit YejE